MGEGRRQHQPLQGKLSKVSDNAMAIITVLFRLLRYS